MNTLPPEMKAKLRSLIKSIDDDMAAKSQARTQAQDEANWAAARDLDAHIPCRVQVVLHEADEDYMTEDYLTDCGRIGWVRTASQTVNLKGEPLATTYIEDMTPDEREPDGNLTRYHEPRHIRRLPD